MLTTLCFAPCFAVQNQPLNELSNMEQTKTVATDNTDEESTPTPYLFTNLNVGLRSDSEYIYAYVYNSFTLFPSTVSVSLALYSSYEYTNDINQMTRESELYIEDLDMGVEMFCKAKNTAKRYWCAYAIYYENNGSPHILQTATILYNLDGSYV